jgi:hypothetical protein
VVLGARVEVLRRRLGWPGDALVLGAQFPPRLVVARRRNFTREDLPAPLVDEEAQWKERNLVQRLSQQERGVAGRRRDLLEKPDLLQVRRSDGESNRIANGLVEAIIRAFWKRYGCLLYARY